MVVNGVGLIFKVIFIGVGHGFDEGLANNLWSFHHLFQKICSEMMGDRLIELSVFFIRVVTHCKKYNKIPYL